MTEQKKTILLDMDDTVNNFTGRFWSTHNEVYNENIDPSTVDDWDLAKFSPHGEKVYDLFKHPGLFRHLEPKENAFDFVKKLDADFDVYFVTDAPSGTSFCEPNLPFSNPADDKRRWIRDHFPFFDATKMLFCSHKWMVHGDILVDDKPQTYHAFEERGRDIVLMDAPYNRHISTKFRAHDLTEAEEMIYDIVKRKK